MRIGYCTWTDPYDKRSWSGVHYFMMEALKKHCGAVTVFGPIPNKFILLGRIFNKITQTVLGKNFHFFHAPFITKEYARILEKRIKNKKLDILFFVSHGVLLNDLHCNIPIVYYSDVTSKLMVNYYEDFTNLLKITEKWYHNVDQKVMDRADIIVFCSQWAADSAIKDYGCRRDKVYVIPLGANFDFSPSREVVLHERQKETNILKLIFVGSDWERKGGEIAFQAMVELNNRGVDTELIVVSGYKLPSHIKHPKLKVIGYLDRNNKAEELKSHELYINSSIFILPTRKEAGAAITFCEASAYGLPIITTNTGGVSAHVEDGVNGYILPLDSCFKTYADVIESVWKDKNRYIALCKTARLKFERELNWDSWGKRMNQIINDNCPKRK